MWRVSWCGLGGERSFGRGGFKMEIFHGKMGIKSFQFSHLHDASERITNVGNDGR